jgi:hypothetical protein
VALFKKDYEEGRLQPTPAGHPKGELLSTGFDRSRRGEGAVSIMEKSKLVFNARRIRK